MGSQLEPYQVELAGVTHVVIEIFGGDNNLSSFVIEDLQEMASGNRGSFAVIALTDFESESASVKVLTPTEGLRTIESLGEIDTGDPETLAVFLARALITTNSIPHKAIGFWDHGSGVFDEFDPDEIYLERRLRFVPRHLRSRSHAARRLFVSPSRFAAEPRMRAMLHDDTNGGVLTNHEAHGVMTSAFGMAGMTGARIDLVFSDTCLNGMVEVLDQFREFADVVVASEDLEPGDGWDYHEWFRRMSENPPESGIQWGRQAVEAFEAGYLGKTHQYPCTLGAFRTDSDLTESMKELVVQLGKCENEGMTWLKIAALDSQSFAQHDTFDIYDFTLRLKEICTSDDVGQACDKVLYSFNNALVHSIALGDSVKNSYGLGFWFPTSQYSYHDIVSTYKKLKYDKATGWTEYLDKYRFI